MSLDEMNEGSGKSAVSLTAVEVEREISWEKGKSSPLTTATVALSRGLCVTQGTVGFVVLRRL